MKYTVKYSTLFKKSFKKCMKRGCYKGCMECHITSDWLLVWKQNDKELILILTDTGTHSDIFGW